jgi:diacylglycerol kinase (ATP)
MISDSNTSSALRQARLILNPVSGDDEPNQTKLPEIVAALEAEGIQAEPVFTKPDESPALIAQAAVQAGCNLVIVGGGDGTVSEVAKGLLHTQVPLGIIPIGTYNNIARGLNLPDEVESACQVIAHGQVKAIDVGQANDEHYFFEAAGVGLDAMLFPLGEEIKEGHWERIVRAAQLAMSYRPQPVLIQFDRPVVEARLQPTQQRRLGQRQLFQRQRDRNRLLRSPLLIVIANAPYYGTGFTVAPGAVLDDGVLTVNIFRNFSKWELLRHFWAISRGQYHYSPKIETYSVAEVRLTSKVTLPVHVDGHPIGTLPATFKSLRAALKVIVPNVSAPDALT